MLKIDVINVIRDYYFLNFYYYYYSAYYYYYSVHYKGYQMVKTSELAIEMVPKYQP